MRKFLLTALAAATILMTGIVVADAATAPQQSHARSARDAAGLPVRIAGIVCGNNGCAPAQTSAPRRRRFMPLGHG